MDTEHIKRRQEIVKEAEHIRQMLKSTTQLRARRELKRRYEKLDAELTELHAELDGNVELGSDTSVLSTGYPETGENEKVVVWRTPDSRPTFIDCPFCAESIRANAIKCRYCGEFLNQRKVPEFDMPQVVGFVGSLVLVFGVFAPLVTIPIIGSQNYFQNGTGDGLVILILAGIAIILIANGRTRWLYLPSVASFGLIGYTFHRFRTAVGKMETEFANDDEYGIWGSALGQVATNSMQMEWGWAVLVIGAALLFTASLMSGFSLKGLWQNSADPDTYNRFY